MERPTPSRLSPPPVPARVKPIRIALHAFGRNRPKRALLLSQDHSEFVEDVLIPIKFLVNGATVMQIDVGTVTYCQLELARHPNRHRSLTSQLMRRMWRPHRNGSV